MAAPSFEELWNDAGDHMPWVVETRRELHRMPELLFDEHMTSGKIASVLASLGVNFTTGWAVNTKREELAAKGLLVLRAESLFSDQDAWWRTAVLNTARGGRFSSDRAIREYADKVWDVRPVKPGVVADHGLPTGD